VEQKSVARLEGKKIREVAENQAPIRGKSTCGDKRTPSIGQKTSRWLRESVLAEEFVQTKKEGGTDPTLIYNKPGN
jgi:hypothetical protein